MKELTEKERAFVRAYTDGPTAGNASKSATAAGYSNGKQAGHEVLKRQHVLKAIAVAERRLRRRREKEPPATPEPEEIDEEPPPVAPTVPAVIQMQEQAEKGYERGTGDAETEQAYQEADADKAARLNRSYVISALMDSFEISLGRKPTVVTQMGKRVTLDENNLKREEITAVQVSIFVRDAAAANRTGELLLKEVERMEADPGSKANEMEGRESLLEAVEAFRQGRAA